VLAYALRSEAPAQGFRVTNYADHLAANPPQFEADIHLGDDGLGSSWSCVHGVGRWMRDCGCHTGGEEGWTQAWRGPLRAALDFLRDTLAPEYERAASELLKDPWAARDAFVQVLLDPNPESKDRFFEAQALRPLSQQERQRALCLLDMQRQCLLMYTSCGWFFNDLAGIETVQILKYAARAMDDALELGLGDLREDFLALLRQAFSNGPEHADGKDLFHTQVEPCRVGPERLAAHCAIMALAALEGDASTGRVGGWNWVMERLERSARGGMSYASARVRLEARVTGRGYDASVVALHFGGMDFVCSVKPWQGEELHQLQAGKVAEALLVGRVAGIISALRSGHGGLEVGLDQVLPDGRERVGRAVFQKLLNQVNEQTARVYQENRHQLDLFQSAGLPLPRELRAAAEYA
ncbi:MAG: DUF3536 domain-containing protein, partial [bacterium]